jgi:hypothetical protein
MGKIDDVQNAIDKRQSERDQRIDSARKHAVENGGKKN